MCHNNIALLDDFEALPSSVGLGNIAEFGSIAAPVLGIEASGCAVSGLTSSDTAAAHVATSELSAPASILSDPHSSASVASVLQADIAPAVIHTAVPHPGVELTSASPYICSPQSQRALQQTANIATSPLPAASAVSSSCSVVASTFRAHFGFRIRFQRLYRFFHLWHQVHCAQRRLFKKLHRMLLMRRNAILSSSFYLWTSLIADRELQIAKSSSNLQQSQLLGLERTLGKCRIYFSNRAKFRLVSSHFGSWCVIARHKILLNIRRAQFASKRCRFLVLDTFLSWGAYVFEKKQQVAQSSFAALQQQQLQRSQNALQHCRLFFSKRLEHKDETSLLSLAFSEWLRRARTLRQASSVAKRFLFRLFNQNVARAFFSWAQVLNLRLRNVKVNQKILTLQLCTSHDAFAEWRSVVRIQKAAQQVDAL
jgi:hypothetical protein